ncbi:MAG: hypothetical protein EOP87_07900, partial [Verrucomicrobiaceae bacterium]
MDTEPVVHAEFREMLDAGAGLPGKPRFLVDSASGEDEAFGMMDTACHGGVHYSLVFMDAGSAPDFRGITAATRLWELDPDVQVVFHTPDTGGCWSELVSRLGHT